MPKIQTNSGRNHQQPTYIHIIMELKKITLLFSVIALASASFLTGCGEKSDADKAADAVEEAGDKATDAVKGLTD